MKIHLEKVAQNVMEREVKASDCRKEKQKTRSNWDKYFYGKPSS